MKRQNGDATIGLGKENWAEGASTIAIRCKNHAAGGGSVALGQEEYSLGVYKLHIWISKRSRGCKRCSWNWRQCNCDGKV